MAGRRKVTIDGTEYFYQLKSKAGVMRLVVEMQLGSYASASFRATAGEGAQVAFTPKDVSAVIRALEFNKRTLPVGFQLEGWRYVEPKPAPDTTKVAPLRPRLGVGTHLSIDDLRALAFEQPGLSIDYVRARAHMGSCRACRGMVEREREENPLIQLELPPVK